MLKSALPYVTTIVGYAKKAAAAANDFACILILVFLRWENSY